MPRADAQRNIDALLAAAKEEFAAHGVDVNVRAIAARAGVGTATLYRHYPLRSDLISAVFRREIDDCAAEAPLLAASHDPDEALELWLQRYTQFVATKYGLAAALHSGDSAYSALPAYFHEHAGPALAMLLQNAEAAGVVRGGVDPLDLLGAVANLCIPPPGSDDNSRAHRMVALLIDGLRYGAELGVEKPPGQQARRCRKCDNCLADMEQYCLEGNIGTYASVDRQRLGEHGDLSAHGVGDDDGLKLSADHYYATSDPATFDELANSFNLIVNTVSAPLDLGAYLRLLSLHGTWSTSARLRRRCPSRYSRCSTTAAPSPAPASAEFVRPRRCLTFAPSTSIAPETELIGADDINDAYERVMHSDVRYRFVIDTATLG